MTSHAALLSRLTLAVAHEPPSQPLTLRVCRATRDLPGADGASITIENSTPHRVTLCATDKLSDRLENLQDVLGEGPCRDAFDALAEEIIARWPAFGPRAAATGFQSVQACPLRSARTDHRSPQRLPARAGRTRQ